jgi:hypothetical protein
MPLERRVVEASLTKKGFTRVEGDHAFFIYYSSSGKKSPVRTKTSHGTGHRDIGDGLIAKMARDCRITTGEFRDLIACPLSREQYETKLLALGLVEPLG